MRNRSVPWHSGIIDRLNVDPEVLHQQIGNVFQIDRAADYHRDDVAWIAHVNPDGIEPRAHLCHARLMSLPLGQRGFQVPDRRRSARSDCWRQGGVKMNLLAKLRTKSHTSADAAI